MLLVSFVSPAMACLAPEAQMTPAERACCRMMKSECGQMTAMPGSHKCCNKIPQALNETALKTGTVAVHPLKVAVLLDHSFCDLTPRSAGADWVRRPELSPPRGQPSTITILRI